MTYVWRSSLSRSQICLSLSLTSMLDPQRLTVPWPDDFRARKTRRPGFDQNIPEVAALLCANFCKKSPIWIAISFLLLAGYSTGCEVYFWTFHLICMHCASACVQIVHNYSQFSDGLSQEFQSPAKIHSLTSWRSNVVGGRTIVHRQAFMFSIRVALCPVCVASLDALLYKKLKSILWQGKGWMNPQYLSNIQRRISSYMQACFCEKSLHWNNFIIWKLDKQLDMLLKGFPLNVYWKQNTPKTLNILILTGTHD